MLDMAHIMKVQSLKDEVVRQFDTGDWLMLENYLGTPGKVISEHPRLLRSMHFGDDDYEACVGEVIGQVLRTEPQSFDLMGVRQDSWTCSGSQPEPSATAVYGLAGYLLAVLFERLEAAVIVP